MSDLNTYSNQNMTYTTYAGFSASITRFKFDGTLDVSNYIKGNDFIDKHINILSEEYINILNKT